MGEQPVNSVPQGAICFLYVSIQEGKVTKAEHSINLDHHIQFKDTSQYPGHISGCLECIIKEAIEIELHPDNMNKEECFSLSKSWNPLLQTPKE